MSLSLAVIRKHCRGIPHRDLLEDYFNKQSGHGKDAADNYAITFSLILNVSDDHLEKFVEISKLQHRLLFPNMPQPQPLLALSVLLKLLLIMKSFHF